MKTTNNAFWEEKKLEDMTQDEWEAVCDGCGKCCLHKFIDDENAEETQTTDQIKQDESLEFTNIVCSYLNTKTCSCTQYAKRTELVPDCVQLTKKNLSQIFYMPTSCSYRRLHEGRGLPSWHPLLNRNKKTVMHNADMSVRGKTVYEHDVDMEDFEDYIVSWPLNDLD